MDLFTFFDYVYNHYNLILKEKGVVGLFKEREVLLDEINSLNYGMFTKRTRLLTEKDLKNAICHLIIFKDILTIIKYTAEVIILVRTILSLISRMSFIPFLVLSI